MCGIFGYIGYRRNSQKIVFDGIKSLEYRGYDSWGIGVVAEKRGKKIISIKKEVGKIGNANINNLLSGNIAFGHTRWATHGGVTKENAHPQLDCTKKIAVIHNGIIENYEDIKKVMLKKGHKFVSNTDTETIVHLIEDYASRNDFTDAVRMAFNKIDGLNAVIALSLNENRLVAVRNGSPLVVGFGNKENFLASDVSALLPYTKDVYFLDDNEMAILTDKEVAVINVKNGTKIIPHKTRINLKTNQTSKGRFEHHMLKEIYEQPRVIDEIASKSFKNIKKISRVIKKSRGTYILGCGTAYHACLAGSYLFSKLAKRHVNVAIGSEFGYSLDFLNKDSLVMAISQSGETMDILESVKKAKEKEAGVISLVNVEGSSLYRFSDISELIGAGAEIAVASTKVFTGMLAHLILLANCLNDNINSGVKNVLKSVISMKKVLAKESVSKIKKLSSAIGNKKHIYVIGRGLSYPLSLETALKIKEISYIHAEGLAAGELKHGPLALVDKGTPCICFLPNDETYGANLAGAMEMKARGGYIVGISYKPHEIFDYYLHVDDAKEATIIPEAVVAQLLAYYLTIGKGLDPDKPRNLAKSVTVK